MAGFWGAGDVCRHHTVQVRFITRGSLSSDFLFVTLSYGLQRVTNAPMRTRHLSYFEPLATSPYHTYYLLGFFGGLYFWGSCERPDGS